MKQAPGASPYKLIDLVPIVREALQQNTSFSDLTACQWLQRAIWEITDKTPFEELRTTGPIVNLPANQQLKIPVSEYLNSNDDITLMADPVVFLDPPSNTIGYPMDYLSMKAIQPLLFVPGAIPFKYSRWGVYFYFGGQPSQSYPTYLPYQLRHPFAPDNILQASPCMFPTAWNEVMAYAAAIRGAVSLRWWQIAAQLKQLLYGDPAGRGGPGMIKELVSQFEKDSSNSTRQITPRVSRY